MITEEKVGLMVFGEEERVMSQEIQVPSKSWDFKGQEIDFLIGPLKPSCQHLEFVPVRLILDF